MGDVLKAIDHPDFQDSFPERFDWEKVDSVSLSALAGELSAAIHGELREGPRLFVPGLRYALVRIAKRAEVCL